MLQLTEGWPVGVSLAARFWRARRDLRRFGGADRLVAGYVRDEILACLPPDRARLPACGASMLDVLTGAGVRRAARPHRLRGVLGELTAARAARRARPHG